MDLAFPYRQVTPAHPSQLGLDTTISQSIASQFFVPKLNSRLGYSVTVRAIVLMPETAVNEDDCASASENQIWRAGKLSLVQPVTVTERMG